MKTSPYTRFIPREELESFSTWTPGALSGEPQPPAAKTAASEQGAARQAGYQDGYRDGLVALDAFKQSYAAQTTAQVGTLLASLRVEIEALEEQMARALAHAAMDLAGQVVRHELAVQPELVASVAREAVGDLMLSARHISVRVHPDDHALVRQGAGEELERRGGRLVADASLSRGGCSVESDVGSIDARIENRWRRAAAALGAAPESGDDEA